MKSRIPFLISVLALGLAAGPLARAEDAKDTKDPNMITVEPPAADAPADTAGKKGHDGKRGQAMAEQRLKTLDETLTLTDDQKAKIKDIYAKEAAGGKDMTSEQRRAALKSVHDQVRAVLTPDQQTKFDAMPKPGHTAKGKGKKTE